jgi:pimeloyl-ACP methyl ester carboxylesterase
MNSLGIEKAHIEGESLGGWVGLWFALHHPERIGKLILNTSAGIRFEPGTIQERPAEGRELLRQRSLDAINNPTPETIRKRLEWLMASPESVTDELAELRFQMYSHPEISKSLMDVFNNSFGSGDNRHYQIPAQKLSEVKAPTLVLWTDKNPGTGPDVGKYISTLIPGARFVCINNAAHWPQWEQPEEHDEVVLSFLRG